MEKKIGVWSPKVKGKPRGSTNPRLAWSGVGTGRNCKWLSGGKLENTAWIVANAKAVPELQKRLARLGIQSIAAGDVLQRPVSQGAWRMSGHEYKRKAEFSGSRTRPEENAFER